MVPAAPADSEEPLSQEHVADVQVTVCVRERKRGGGGERQNDNTVQADPEDSEEPPSQENVVKFS